ncbi:hypothetical protein SOVF_066540 [Spinacia oleracea]|nr:hypothetical protein SOVF_066540 [Spinacia oleracea]
MPPPQHIPPPLQEHNGSNEDELQVRGRGQTSWVWPYYERVLVEQPNLNANPNGPKPPKRFMCTCVICKAKGVKPNKSFSWTSGHGTGTLGRHLNKHGLYSNSEEDSEGGELSGQTQLHRYMNHLPGGGKPFFYSRDKMVDGMSKFVISQELPFYHGESDDFEEFTRNTLQPAF